MADLPLEYHETIIPNRNDYCILSLSELNKHGDGKGILMDNVLVSPKYGTIMQSSSLMGNKIYPNLTMKESYLVESSYQLQ